MIFILLQIDNPQPQYPHLIIVGFRLEDLFFIFIFFEITSLMAEIGGFRTEDLFSFGDQCFFLHFLCCY